MSKLLASVFASLGAVFGGWFGGHATTTPEHWMSSTTPPAEHHMASTTPWGDRGMGTTTPGHMGMAPGVFGKVTAISGDTLTINGRAPGSTATTTYTVDATNARILMGGMYGDKMGSSTQAMSLSDIKVNDGVLVTGTVTGTNITAKTIVDGMMRMMMGNRPPHPQLAQ